MTPRNRKILIMGLPGAGKTTLAAQVAACLKAVHFNADDVRQRLNKDLGFSRADRIEQAKRMSWLCDVVVVAGHYAIADFICPTPETRAAFGPAFVIWVDRVKASKFPDTDRIFVPPEHYDIRVLAEGAPPEWAQIIVKELTGARAPQGGIDLTKRAHRNLSNDQSGSPAENPRWAIDDGLR